MRPNPQFSADLVAFTEETLNGNLHFLCSDWRFLRYFSANKIPNKNLRYRHEMTPGTLIFLFVLLTFLFWQQPTRVRTTFSLDFDIIFRVLASGFIFILITLVISPSRPNILNNIKWNREFAIFCVILLANFKKFSDCLLQIT